MKNISFENKNDNSNNIRKARSISQENPNNNLLYKINTRFYLNTINIENSISKKRNYLSKSVLMNEISIRETEKRICQICDEEYIKSNQTQLDNCLHSFCKNCWLNYLKISIKDKKQIKMKCMDHLCEEILPEEFIYSIIKNNRNLIYQYNENKIREEILNNPNKKFCPYPNCNSYMKREKHEKNVKCGNGHLSCFYCLKKPHEGKCIKELDEKMEEYAKKKFIKKCPNCGCWTEKNEGCNHITCIECNFQWCWLCNQQYTSDHYSIGKCKGFQFFKPKNEEEIQLAFQGKIQLRDDERMDFSIIDDFSFEIPENEFYDRRIDFYNEDRIFLYNKCEKFAILIIFLLFGLMILVICESGQYLSNVRLNGNTKMSFFTIIYFFVVVLFGFSVFSLQILINFYLFFLTIIFHSLDTFFNDFSFNLRKINNPNIFINYHSIISHKVYNFLSFIISIFFGCSFWIIRLIKRKLDIWFILNERKSQIVLNYFFLLNFILINISFFSISFLLNFIGILVHIVEGKLPRLRVYILDTIIFQ